LVLKGHICHEGCDIFNFLEESGQQMASQKAQTFVAFSEFPRTTKAKKELALVWRQCPISPGHTTPKQREAPRRQRMILGGAGGLFSTQEDSVKPGLFCRLKDASILLLLEKTEPDTKKSWKVQIGLCLTLFLWRGHSL
jgi:hypothetical protein